MHTFLAIVQNSSQVSAVQNARLQLSALNNHVIHYRHQFPEMLFNTETQSKADPQKLNLTKSESYKEKSDL